MSLFMPDVQEMWLIAPYEMRKELRYIAVSEMNTKKQVRAGITREVFVRIYHKSKGEVHPRTGQKAPGGGGGVGIGG
jgi:hypothetical protein